MFIASGGLNRPFPRVVIDAAVNRKLRKPAEAQDAIPLRFDEIVFAPEEGGPHEGLLADGGVAIDLLHLREQAGCEGRFTSTVPTEVVIGRESAVPRSVHLQEL